MAQILLSEITLRAINISVYDLFAVAVIQITCDYGLHGKWNVW